MAFYCPKCEPDRRPTYGFSPGLCERHGQPDVVDVEAAPAPDTPETRTAAFNAAMAAGDAASAYAIARAPLPADWPEDARRPWSARRELARMALDAGEDAADADSDRRDFEAGDDLTWRDAGSGS